MLSPSPPYPYTVRCFCTSSLRGATKLRNHWMHVAHSRDEPLDGGIPQRTPGTSPIKGLVLQRSVVLLCDFFSPNFLPHRVACMPSHMKSWPCIQLCLRCESKTGGRVPNQPPNVRYRANMKTKAQWPFSPFLFCFCFPTLYKEAAVQW